MRGAAPHLVAASLRERFRPEPRQCVPARMQPMERGGAVEEGARTVRVLGAPAPEAEVRAPIRIPKILLVGAGGALGRALLEELLRETTADVVLAGPARRPLRHALRAAGPSRELRLSCLELDPWNSEQVTRSLLGVRLAICAAGPAHAFPTALAQECVRLGVDYLDLADDRAFVSRVRSLGAGAGAALATGWGASPALSAALVHAGCADLDAIDSIQVTLAPGLEAFRSWERAAALLHALTHPFKIPRKDLWSTIAGWTEPDEFHFPAPLGTVRGRLIDAPELELFGELFATRRVEVRLAPPSAPIARALGAIAWRARRASGGEPVGRRGPARALLAVAAAAGGTAAGGVGVRVAGRYGRRPLTKVISLVAPDRGERLAVFAASILAARLMSAAPSPRGVLRHDTWIAPDELRAACRDRGLQLSIEER